MRISSAVSLRSLQCERMLDIGCDTGSFLASAARQFAIVPVGIDVSYRAVQEASSKEIEAYLTVIENAPSHLKGFKLITPIDVVEHVISPAVLLGEAFSRLSSGGILYLETPKISSALYRVGDVSCRRDSAGSVR